MLTLAVGFSGHGAMAGTYIGLYIQFISISTICYEPVGLSIFQLVS